MCFSLSERASPSHNQILHGLERNRTTIHRETRDIASFGAEPSVRFSGIPWTVASSRPIEHASVCDRLKEDFSRQTPEMSSIINAPSMVESTFPWPTLAQIKMIIAQALIVFFINEVDTICSNTTLFARNSLRFLQLRRNF
jgi:hypothetical protein